MKALYILYDASCGLCNHSRIWLENQPAYLRLSFIPQGSAEVQCRFPSLKIDNPPKELIVVSDEGNVYRRSSAWIMCLYALREYRQWSSRLAHPVLLPFAQRFIELISTNRLAISHLLKLDSNRELIVQIQKADRSASPPPLPN